MLDIEKSHLPALTYYFYYMIHQKLSYHFQCGKYVFKTKRLEVGNLSQIILFKETRLYMCVMTRAAGRWASRHACGGLIWEDHPNWLWDGSAWSRDHINRANMQSTCMHPSHPFLLWPQCNSCFKLLLSWFPARMDSILNCELRHRLLPEVAPVVYFTTENKGLCLS